MPLDDSTGLPTKIFFGVKMAGKTPRPKYDAKPKGRHFPSSWERDGSPPLFGTFPGVTLNGNISGCNGVVLVLGV